MCENNYPPTPLIKCVIHSINWSVRILLYMSLIHHDNSWYKYRFIDNQDGSVLKHNIGAVQNKSIRYNCEAMSAAASSSKTNTILANELLYSTLVCQCIPLYIPSCTSTSIQNYCSYIRNQFKFNKQDSIM